MQVLNNYIDRLSRGQPLSEHNVQFCTASSGQIRTVEAVLPASGNLGPLFHAFGLISKDEVGAHHTTTPGLQPVYLLSVCLLTATYSNCPATVRL